MDINANIFPNRDDWAAYIIHVEEKVVNLIKTTTRAYVFHCKMSAARKVPPVL